MKTAFIVKQQAMDDFYYWSKHDNKLLKKIIELLESIRTNPFQGIGKPEGLKGDLAGYWSRIINEEHRLVYCVKKDAIIIVSARSHYKNMNL